MICASGTFKIGLYATGADASSNRASTCPSEDALPADPKRPRSGPWHGLGDAYRFLTTGAGRPDEPVSSHRVAVRAVHSSGPGG